MPKIMSIKPIFLVYFFIKTLNLLQIYEIIHFSLFTFHFFSYLYQTVKVLSLEKTKKIGFFFGFLLVYSYLCTRILQK